MSRGASGLFGGTGGGGVQCICVASGGHADAGQQQWRQKLWPTEVHPGSTDDVRGPESPAVLTHGQVGAGSGPLPGPWP